MIGKRPIRGVYERFNWPAAKTSWAHGVCSLVQARTGCPGRLTLAPIGAPCVDYENDFVPWAKRISKTSGSCRPMKTRNVDKRGNAAVYRALDQCALTIRTGKVAYWAAAQSWHA